MKKILTVLGPISPDELGVTMMHEHVVVDLTCNFRTPEEVGLRSLRHRPVTADMQALLRRRPFSSTLDNVILDEEDVAIEELEIYRRAGGRAIVDCTSLGIGRDPKTLYRVAQATGLNIVMGGGCYVEAAHLDWVQNLTIGELAKRFALDTLVGVDDTGIRSGIIGEIGTSGISKGSTQRDGDVTKAEEKVLRAAGRAAVRTGVAVSVHVDSQGHGAFRVLDILEDEGLPPERIILGHMDLVPELDYHREVARRGAYVQYDCLGREYYSEATNRPWGNDEWRIASIATLIAEGFGAQLLLSQDIALKMDLVRYGGIGYAYLIRELLPMFVASGVSQDDLVQMLVRNPQRVLSIEWTDEFEQHVSVLQRPS